MKNSKGYNGYKNYNQWNQSLWINNDEGLYRMAWNLVVYKQRTTSKDACALAMLNQLHDMGITHTPDGVKWSKAGIRAGMAGL